MRASKWLMVMAVCAMGLAATAMASAMPGVADVQKVSFDSPIRIGGTLVPAGDDEVRHVMEGENHIRVFYDISRKNSREVRVKCTLVSLGQKADQTQKIYVVNAASEQVPEELIFRGDMAKHVLQ